MEKLSDKEWLALRRYSTAPLSEVWRDAIDIVLLQRPTSYTVEEVCAAYNKPKPKTEETAASWNEEQIRKSICSAWQPWWSADIDGPNFADHVYAALKGQKPKTTEQVSDADKVISGLAQALTDGQVQCTELEAQFDEARKAAKWKDELLKEFDTAAGTILEDAGCLHDDGLVCEICQPFVDARKKYADHINVPKPKTAEERVHEILVGCGCTTEKFNEIMALIVESKRKGSAEERQGR